MSRYSILILTHNRLEAVQCCFESLIKSHIPWGDTQILVLDNASTDGTAEYVTGTTWGALLSKTNLGVAGGRARLLEMACGERVVFLDSDTEIVDPNWLDVLDKALKPEAVGVVGPYGSFVKDDWSGFVAGRPGEVDTVAGACVMIKRELFDHGLKIDTSFSGFWHEDADAALTARSMGFDVICCPVGVLHHPAHSGYGQDMELHDANFARLRAKWQGKGLVRCEGGY